MPVTPSLLIRGAAGLLLVLAACPAGAQAPLIPPAPPLPSPAAPLPASSAVPGLIPPAPGHSPPAVSAPVPGLPELPLAAPPAASLAPEPTRLRARLSLPLRTPKLPPVLPALPHVTEQQVVYGHSAQGRALTAFVLDNGVPGPGNVTLVFGGFHGNERSTPGVVDRLHRWLRQTPHAWLGHRVLLVPQANPDGVALGTRDNARGVDINRNFPTGWANAARAVRYSPGSYAASEPETQAIIALLARYRPAKIISLHSPLRCLNWTGRLGRAMASLMHATDHLPIKAYIGYPTPGSLGDYCGARRIGIVTLELADEDADAAWQENRAAFAAVINLRPAADAQRRPPRPNSGEPEG